MKKINWSSFIIVTVIILLSLLIFDQAIASAQATDDGDQQSAQNQDANKAKEDYMTRVQREMAPLIKILTQGWDDSYRWVFVILFFLLFCFLSWVPCRAAVYQINKNLGPNDIAIWFHGLLICSLFESWILGACAHCYFMAPFVFATILDAMILISIISIIGFVVLFMLAYTLPSKNREDEI